MDTRLAALIIVVDNGRALVMTQNDGAQDPISTLKKSTREIPSRTTPSTFLSMHDEGRASFKRSRMDKRGKKNRTRKEKAEWPFP